MSTSTNTTNKTLNPASLIVAERKVLRLALEDEQYLTRLTPEVFISDTATNLFNAALELKQNSAQLNAENLAAELGVSPQRITTFFETEVPTTGDFTHWSQRLRVAKAQHNIQQEILNNLLPAAAEKEGGSKFDITKVSNLLTRVQENLEVASGRENLLYDAPELLRRYNATIEDRATGKYYYDTGCHHLNNALTEGFPPGRITTLFGSSGVGKSTYALYLVNSHINKQIPELYISLEMDMVATMDRLIAQRNNIPINHLIPKVVGAMDDGDYQYDYIHHTLQRERKRLGAASRFYFIEEPGLSLADIEYYIGYVQRKIGQRYLIVTVDLLTMVKDFNQNENKASGYEDAMNATHELAKRTGAHIIGVVQARRPQARMNVQTVADLDKLRPQIEDIKNSSAFEERSRTILSTFRKRFFGERLLEGDAVFEMMSDIMEVKVLKQNMGSMPLRYYRFQADSARITPYVPASDEEDPYLADAYQDIAAGAV